MPASRNENKLDSRAPVAYNADVSEQLSDIPGEPVLYSDILLHGSYYAPATSPRAAVLLVPPLFEEKRSAHRAMTTCARALAATGAAVLHADLYGTGNSRGSLADISLDRWMDDIQAAADYTADRSQAPLTILGCRAGALLAAHAIAGGLRAEKFVLWQPVVTGSGYLNQLRTLRAIQDQITGDSPPEVGPFEVEGHALSEPLYNQLQALRLPAEMPPIALRLLQCSFNDRLLGEYVKHIVNQWGEERVHVRCVQCETFWHAHSPGEYSALAEAVVEEVLS